LSKFNLKFKAYDSDHDGVLNEQEFKELLRNLKVIDKEEDIEFLL
jgi:Ca2+-binding EF-hand superfamily protein